MGDNEEVYDPGGFLSVDSICYRDDIMMTLKFDWSNLKILISG